ncbi:MAG: hypothetical protein A4S12_02610 [Proteobacteria bacterium SG_bin5]|nr:M67 family metallopeptidase [Sphingomonas sp.]OQW39313.1 MAG: hypothetical protein A4S12_02610 [Proteobacteria bacterium SG_bin5]
MAPSVSISSALLTALRARAAASPVEICGLLLGAPGAILEAPPCANVAAEPERRFELDPAALFAAHRRAREGGPAILGHYHSHPEGPARPSAEDARQAAADGALWLILAAREARLWRAVAAGAWHGRFDPVALMVAPPCDDAPPSP